MDKTILAQKLAALSADGGTFENGRRVISDGSEPPGSDRDAVRS